MEEKIMDRKKLTALIAAAAMIMIAIIVSIMVIVSRDPAEKGKHGVVYEVIGSATLSRPGESSAAVSKGLLLKSGDSLITGPDGFIKFNIDENEVILLEENSKVTLTIKDEGENSHTELFIAYGAVTSEIIQPLTDGSSFSVSSSNAQAIARGTVYRLAEIDGKSVLQVFNGVVDMAMIDENGNAGAAVRFTSGQQGAVTVDGDGPVAEEFTAPEQLPESLLGFLMEIASSGLKDLVFDETQLQSAIDSYEVRHLPVNEETIPEDASRSEETVQEDALPEKNENDSPEPAVKEPEKPIKKQEPKKPEPKLPEPEEPKDPDPKPADPIVPVPGPAPQPTTPNPVIRVLGYNEAWNISYDVNRPVVYYMYNDQVFAKQNIYVVTGFRANEPLLMPAPAGTWQLNGEDFDFNTVITCPTFLVFKEEQAGE